MVARPKIGRLANCEYVSPDSNSDQVSRARLALFDAVERVFPTFLKTLSVAVFPFYQELADAGCVFWGLESSHLSPFELVTQGSPANSAGYLADTFRTIKKRKKLKSALYKWATQFNAKDERWLLDDALRTLRGWHDTPEWRESLKWSPFYGHPSSVPSTGDALQFRYPGWETQLFTWSRYSQLIRKQFEDELSEYEKRTRSLAESCGLIRSQHKYSPANFDWFVLYQFGGQSSTLIANGMRGEDADSTVVKGIKAAAKLVGWRHLRKLGDQTIKNRKIR